MVAWSLNVTQIVIATFIGVIYLVYVPLTIVCAVILFQNKSQQIFRSRRPISLQYIIVISLLSFAIVHPFRMFDGSIPNNPWNLQPSVPLWICSSVECSVTMALLLLYAQRAFLIHYDVMHHKALFNEWKSQHQSQLQWYLTRRNRFGSHRFTLYIIAAMWTLFSTTLSLCNTLLDA